MVRLFFGNRSYALLFLPLMVGAFFACNQITDYHPLPETLNFGFWGSASGEAFWWTDYIAPVLVLGGSILINTLFNRNEFMERNNFLSSLVYVSLMSFFPAFYHLSGFAIALILSILAMIHVLRLNQNQDGRRSVFNASFLFGVACTFYPVLLIGVPFLFWIIWVLRPFILRESLLILTGFTVPLVYAGIYSFVFQTKLERDQFSSSSAELHMIDMIVLVAIVVLLLLISSRPLLGKLRVSSIRLKKLFRVLGLFVGLGLSIVALEFLVFKKLSTMAILLFPLTFVLPYAFGDREQRKFPTVIFYLLFLFSVGKFFLPFDQITF